LFEYSDEDKTKLKEVIDNYGLLHATNFDVCILRSTYKGFGYKKSIHVWISAKDYENSNLMILLAYILTGHPDWKQAEIKIFSGYSKGEYDVKRQALVDLIATGRLPISPKNIELIPQQGELISRTIEQKSGDADLTILGYSSAVLDQRGAELFNDLPNLGNTLFVSAYNDKAIE